MAAMLNAEINKSHPAGGAARSLRALIRVVNRAIDRATRNPMRRKYTILDYVVFLTVGVCLFVFARSCSAIDISAGRVDSDLIFAHGLEDEAPGAPVCNPPPAGYFRGGPFTLAALWNPQPIGSTLVQVKLSGDSYEAYSFTRADLPADLSEFQADTSNVGPGAVGADFRQVAISECEGDFFPTQAACSVVANEGAYLYLNFGAPLPFACNLDVARQYYFNVTFGASPCNTGLNRNSCAFRTAVLPR